jgi:putative transposase
MRQHCDTYLVVKRSQIRCGFGGQARARGAFASFTASDNRGQRGAVSPAGQVDRFPSSEPQVRKYRPRSRGYPSQGWRTFLRNHAGALAAMDFFVVPTATWTAQQVINAFPYDTAPGCLLRDRDSIYGSVFVQRVEGMGIKEKLISPRSPWQNPYVERLIGSIRRKCLDRVIVLNQQQLHEVLEAYFQYYHSVRPHRSLCHDSPVPRPVQSPDCGEVIEMPLIGGLHHRYLRQAA